MKPSLQLVAATACLLLAVALSAADPPRHRKFEFVEPHMGTQFKIQLYAADEKTANQAARTAFDRIAALDRMLTDYDSKSELSRLSATSPSTVGVPVSRELWTVLEKGQRIATDTGGAFDVTVGPLTRLWRRARRQQQMPAKERLAEALAATGYRHVKLDRERRTIQLTRPGMRLDLGGIAKGYAADEALAVLKKAGVARAVVAASGDMAIGEPPPGEKGWRIAVGSLDPAKNEPTRFLRLANCGVSTSGDAYQFVVLDGKRYSHIVDPRTGLGLTHRVSVTVVAPDGTTSDPLATAICVLGPKAGVEVAKESRGVEALVTYAGDDGGSPVQSVETRGFARLCD
jgi:thiamine biosynthesis lipoprotein